LYERRIARLTPKTNLRQRRKGNKWDFFNPFYDIATFVILNVFWCGSSHNCHKAKSGHNQEKTTALQCRSATIDNYGITGSIFGNTFVQAK